MNGLSKNHHLYPAIILCGPTGSGKTELLSSLNPDLFEVISFDSRQVYSDLEIGTSRPHFSDLTIQYHMVGIHTSDQKTNGFDYVSLAKSSFEKIIQKNKIPILSSGTGFYLNAFLFGMFEVPKISDEIKNLILSLSTEEKIEKLRFLDPIALEQLPKNDIYRLDRALEVNLAGVKWSSLSVNQNEGYLNKMEILGSFFIDWPREELYNRINRRALFMIKNGLLEETEKVKNLYGENCPGLNSLGYNFALDILRGELKFETFYEKLAQSHRNYAKKQITWFRKLSILNFYSWDKIKISLEKVEYGKHNGR